DPSGQIYVIHGDSVAIPDDFTSLVPATNEFENSKPVGGHVIQTNVEGDTWKVFCSGLRNPYGLALNDAGEFFTYDADAEAHVGLPWYRPTRIVHLMPGVDYGWRESGSPWPGYLPDSMPPIATIGRGSPTALKFAYSSSFPAAYRHALIALDWSYGRILAVHLVPKGSTYSAHAEVLVRGRPFSVCDLDFEKDGSMLVITGGRDTQSRLYRIRYVGNQSPVRCNSRQVRDRSEYSQKMRAHRRHLESLYGQQGPSIVSRAWNELAHPDLGIRSAARLLLEHQPLATWQDRLLAEQRPAFALPALLAIVRTGPSGFFPEISEKLHSLSLSSTAELQMAIRIESLLDKKLPKADKRSRAICDRYESRYPIAQRQVDRELCRLLIEHQSNVVVARTLDMLAGEMDQVDRFHYLVCLAGASNGWNSDRHDEFFRLLNSARLFDADEGLDSLIQGLFDLAIRRVPQSQQVQYHDLFAANSIENDTEVVPLPFVKQWTVSEITDRLTAVKHSTNVKNGAQVFKAASCSRCHRFGTTGQSFGPDLTTVAARFSRNHILKQIVEPSKTVASQYQNYVITLSSGKTITGRVVYNGFRKSILRVATDPMDLYKTTEIKKGDIESFQESGVSPMPGRLLDTLSIQQIADLLAYLESGSD
ncbi:MAG: c-type cytochrome, partial [Bythopirellula sp.]